MRSTSRVPVWASILAVATAAGLLAVAGCALDKPENQPKQVFDRIGGRGGGGQILQPRQCLVRVLILERPFKDPAINEIAWRVADEQILSQAERKTLTANGLRVGRIIGVLPKELETILNGEGPDRARLEPSNLLLESGQSTLVCTTPRVPEVELLINRDDRITGRPYRDASGYLRLTPRHHGAHAVSLRVIPEIHHGPLQRSFPSLPSSAGLAPQQLTIRDAQKEEPLNELGVDLVLEEGQVAIIGSRPENLQSLGTFLFSKQAAENAERRQRLIMIWATRNMAGVVAEAPKGADRPRFLRKRVAPPDEPPANPAPPDPGPPSIPPTPEPTSAGKKP